MLGSDAGKPSKNKKPVVDRGWSDQIPVIGGKAAEALENGKAKEPDALRVVEEVFGASVLSPGIIQNVYPGLEQSHACPDGLIYARVEALERVLGVRINDQYLDRAPVVVEIDKEIGSPPGSLAPAPRLDDVLAGKDAPAGCVLVGVEVKVCCWPCCRDYRPRFHTFLAVPSERRGVPGGPQEEALGN